MKNKQAFIYEFAVETAELLGDSTKPNIFGDASMADLFLAKTTIRIKAADLSDARRALSQHKDFPKTGFGTKYFYGCTVRLVSEKAVQKVKPPPPLMIRTYRRAPTRKG